MVYFIIDSSHVNHTIAYSMWASIYAGYACSRGQQPACGCKELCAGKWSSTVKPDYPLCQVKEGLSLSWLEEEGLSANTALEGEMKKAAVMRKWKSMNMEKSCL